MWNLPRYILYNFLRKAQIKMNAAVHNYKSSIRILMELYAFI